MDIRTVIERALWRRSLPRDIQDKLREMDRLASIYHGIHHSWRFRHHALVEMDKLSLQVKSYAGFSCD